MKILQEMALRHGLAVLFHEKPFARLNGNGKHNNWGLNTDTGKNLFVPGIFYIFIFSFIQEINQLNGFHTKLLSNYYR